SLEQRNIEHSVLRTATPNGVASFDEIYRSMFGQQESKRALQEGASGRPIAKPYTTHDVELLQEALNDGAKTYAGIIDASRQPGAIGDDGGSGVNPTALRELLNDCMSARLVWTEKNHGKDYYYYHDNGVGLDWVEVLGLRE